MSAPNLISPTTLSGGTPVGGSGTSSPSTIPRWTGPSTLGDSVITQDANARAIGVGVTPNASWPAAYRAIQLGQTAAWMAASGGANDAWLMSNSYWDGASFRYLGNGPAMAYAQGATGHRWLYFGSGSAGTAFSFTDGMILNTSGNVGIGTASPSGRFHVLNNSANALARFESSIANGAYALWHNGTNTALFAGFGSTLDSAATVDDAVLRYQATKVLIISRGGSEAARFDSSGNLILNSANTGATIQAAGTSQGLKLPATPGNADTQTLDCYEENTWTPTRAGFGGTNPTVTASYTRVGRLVTITVRIVATGGAQYSGTSPTTTLSIPATITPAANTTASSIMTYGDTTTVGTVTAWNDGLIYLPTFALTTQQTSFSITYRV